MQYLPDLNTSNEHDMPSLSEKQTSVDAWSTTSKKLATPPQTERHPEISHVSPPFELEATERKRDHEPIYDRSTFQESEWSNVEGAISPRSKACSLEPGSHHCCEVSKQNRTLQATGSAIKRFLSHIRTLFKRWPEQSSHAQEETLNSVSRSGKTDNRSSISTFPHAPGIYESTKHRISKAQERAIKEANKKENEQRPPMEQDWISWPVDDKTPLCSLGIPEHRRRLTEEGDDLEGLRCRKHVVSPGALKCDVPGFYE